MCIPDVGFYVTGKISLGTSCRIMQESEWRVIKKIRLERFSGQSRFYDSACTSYHKHAGDRTEDSLLIYILACEFLNSARGTNIIRNKATKSLINPN